MPLLLKGSCRCGAVKFEVESHTPAPFMLCYCSICRKQQGGGGYAINLGGISDTLKVTGKGNLGVYRAEIVDEEGPDLRRCVEVDGGGRFGCKDNFLVGHGIDTAGSLGRDRPDGQRPLDAAVP